MIDPSPHYPNLVNRDDDEYADVPPLVPIYDDDYECRPEEFGSPWDYDNEVFSIVESEQAHEYERINRIMNNIYDTDEEEDCRQKRLEIKFPEVHPTAPMVWKYFYGSN
jgi:hypothetical protein